MRSDEVMMCPFCRESASPQGRPWACGGSFLDRDHPSAVRPLLTILGADGEPTPESEARLVEAKASYRR